MFDRKAYPKDWPAIRQRILARAGNRCEGTWQHPKCRVRNGQIHPETGSKVVLTIAHFPDPTKLNCADDNLRALCQRCHLNLDRPYHMAVRRENQRKKREAIQPTLSAPDGERLA